MVWERLYRAQAAFDIIRFITTDTPSIACPFGCPFWVGEYCCCPFNCVGATKGWVTGKKKSGFSITVDKKSHSGLKSLSA